MSECQERVAFTSEQCGNPVVAHYQGKDLCALHLDAAKSVTKAASQRSRYRGRW